jgi:hypothetical protein
MFNEIHWNTNYEQGDGAKLAKIAMLEYVLLEIVSIIFNLQPLPSSSYRLKQLNERWRQIFPQKF